MNAGLSLRTVANIVGSLCMSNPNRNLTVSQLEDDFAKMVGQPVPFAALGFASTLELLRNIPETVQVTGSIVRAVLKPNLAHMHTLMINNRATNRAKYQKQKNTLSPSSIVDSQRQSNATIRPSAPHQPRVRVGSNRSYQRQNEQQQQRNAISWINSLTIPTDSMDMCDRFPKLNLHALNKSTVRVSARHVLNPNRLWIHLDSATTAFRKIMTELNEYFGGSIMGRQRESRDSLERVHTQEGMPCAAEWQEQWYRATIAGPVLGTQVMVFLVDVGRTETVRLCALKYLPKIFSTTPVQAIRASMACLAPQKAYWRRKDSHDLQNMFNELGTLDAFVMDVDQTSASLDVILFSSNGYNVNREFAALSEGKWLGENFAGQNDAAYRQRLKTFNEQYPSFTDIEEGRYPTVAELERALLREFDFEHHYTKTAHGQRALTVVKEFKLSPRRFALNTLPLSNPFRELFE